MQWLLLDCHMTSAPDINGSPGPDDHSLALHCGQSSTDDKMVEICGVLYSNFACHICQSSIKQN